MFVHVVSQRIIARPVHPTQSIGQRILDPRNVRHVEADVQLFQQRKDRLGLVKEGE
jgi:hypothetical protein